MMNLQSNGTLYLWTPKHAIMQDYIHIAKIIFSRDELVIAKEEEHPDYREEELQLLVIHKRSKISKGRLIQTYLRLLSSWEENAYAKQQGKNFVPFTLSGQTVPLV